MTDLRCHIEPIESSISMRRLLQDLVAGSPALEAFRPHLQGMPPAVLIRGETGAIGLGMTALVSVPAEQRFENASREWDELLSSVAIQVGDRQIGSTERADRRPHPAAGLLAFGSFSFSDKSARASRLLVPRVVVFSDAAGSWLALVATPRPDSEENEADAGGEVWQLLGSTARSLVGSLERWGAAPSEAPAERAHLASGHHFAERQAGQIEQRESFCGKVSLALERIDAGELSKVVLARAIDLGEAEPSDLSQIAVKLAGANPESWVYQVADSVGASPELLMRLDGGQVSARVLAGTASRGTDQGVDAAIADALVRSEKNRAEHDFAVRSLLDKLEPLCRDLKVSEPYPLAFPKLWHLATDVDARLIDSTSPLELVATVHPTAAVAGTPTDRAMTLIAELEDIDRGSYAGPVGWISSSGSAEWVIALRGAELRNDRLLAFAGCGIVAGSEPIAEFEETELKFAAIRASVEW